MTNEQKIQKLKVFRDNGKVLLDPCLIDKDKLWKEMTEVFDMAIEALQSPLAQPDTYEALRILDAINSSGRLDYGDYCDIHDAISEIRGTQNG